MRHGNFAFILSLIMAVAGHSKAADPTSDVPDAATLAHDRRVVNETLQASQTRGFDVVRDRMADLQAIMAHAPKNFSLKEERGRIVYVRETSPENCLAAMLEFADDKSSAHAERAVCVDNPYPLAALLIGSYLDDVRRPDEGLAMLDRGLAFDPHFPVLVAEKGASLNMLHRPAEALAVYQGGLSEIPILDDWQRGSMLRGEGYALVELKRYDEAKQAYEASLKIDPGHGHAAEELAYIACVRSGCPATPMTFNAAIPPSTPPK